MLNTTRLVLFLALDLYYCVFVLVDGDWFGGQEKCGDYIGSIYFGTGEGSDSTGERELCPHGKKPG